MAEDKTRADEDSLMVDKLLYYLSRKDNRDNVNSKSMAAVQRIFEKVDRHQDQQVPQDN